MSSPTNSVLALLLAATTPLVAQTLSCHIHPPGSTPERPRNTVGPFDSIAECERERLARFGASGRCHCAADFSPRWLPTDPTPMTPGDSPLG